MQILDKSEEEIQARVLEVCSLKKEEERRKKSAVCPKVGSGEAEKSGQNQNPEKDPKQEVGSYKFENGNKNDEPDDLGGIGDGGGGGGGQSF